MAITAYGPMEISSKQAGQPRRPWSPAARAKAIKTTTERGDTLLADGYKVEAAGAAQPGIYFVYRPENQPLPKGSALWYSVDIINGECDCTMFEFGGTCRHLVGTLKIVAEALRLVLPLIPDKNGPTERNTFGFATRAEFVAARTADFGD